MYSQIQNIHKYAKLISNYKKFWVSQNADPIIKPLHKIYKTMCKTYWNMWFFNSRLYTKLPDGKLKSKLSSIVDFAFKEEDKIFTRLSNNGTAHRGKWQKRDLISVKHRLKQILII